MLVVASCLLYLLHLSSSVSGDELSFTVSVPVNEVKNIKSPNYPLPYESGIHAKWKITCPSGYNCKLACTEFELPMTSPCGEDSVIVSKIGSATDENAERHCGDAPFSVVSDGSTLLMQLTSDYNRATTGKFNCMVQAVPK